MFAQVLNEATGALEWAHVGHEADAGAAEGADGAGDSPAAEEVALVQSSAYLDMLNDAPRNAVYAQVRACAAAYAAPRAAPARRATSVRVPSARRPPAAPARTWQTQPEDVHANPGPAPA